MVPRRLRREWHASLSRFQRTPTQRTRTFQDAANNSCISPTDRHGGGHTRFRGPFCAFGTLFGDIFVGIVLSYLLTSREERLASRWKVTFRPAEVFT